MELPKDPIMLLSFINTKLRDEYPTLSALCEDLAADETAIRGRLAEIGYEYSAALNKFV